MEHCRCLRQCSILYPLEMLVFQGYKNRKLPMSGPMFNFIPPENVTFSAVTKWNIAIK